MRKYKQKIIIKCSQCCHCREYRKFGNTRSEFTCNHPDHDYILNYFYKNKIQKMPGFLGFGEKYSHTVPLKTSPRWCPEKKNGISNIIIEDISIDDKKDKIKYAIFKTKVGLYYTYYVDNMKDLENHLCRYSTKEEELPIIINRVGGKTSFYPISDKFIKIIIANENQDPLSREEMYPKNSSDFEFGWISPEGDTYNTGYKGHSDSADYICKELGFICYNQERELENRGWIKITGTWEKGSFIKEVFCMNAELYITQKQAAVLFDLGLHTNRNVKMYIEASKEKWKHEKE